MKFFDGHRVWEVGDRVTYRSSLFHKYVSGTIKELAIGNGIHTVLLDGYNISKLVNSSALKPFIESIEDGEITYA